MPKISAIFSPGNVNAFERRKNSPASRSRVAKPSGIEAIQLCSRSSRMAEWKRSPRSSGSA